MSDLIVAASYEGVSGAAVLEAVPVAGKVASMAEAFGDGNIGSGIINAGGAALDVVGMLANPIATLASSCASFLLDYMPPLHQALEMLTGSPEMVRAMAATWDNLAQALQEVAQQREAALQTLLSSWEGVVADVYEKTAQALSQVVATVGAASTSVANGLRMAAMVVEIVYEIVKGIISDLVGQLIQAVVVALATVGVGIPVVVTQCTTFIARKAPQVLRWIEKIQEVAKQIDEAVSSLTQFQKVLHGRVEAVNGALSAVRTFDVSAINLVSIVQSIDTAANNSQEK